MFVNRCVLSIVLACFDSEPVSTLCSDSSRHAARQQGVKKSIGVELPDGSCIRKHRYYKGVIRYKCIVEQMSVGKALIVGLC